jgi:Putative Zn-dependent protease, contains TPR repeats
MSKGKAMVAMLLTVFISLSASLVAAATTQDGKILEAEIIGAKSLASRVISGTQEEKLVLAWLWAEPVVYSASAKPSNMAPKNLLVPESSEVEPEVLNEGRALWKMAEEGIKNESLAPYVLMHRAAWREYGTGSQDEALILYGRIPEDRQTYWSAIRLGELWSKKDAEKAAKYYQLAYEQVKDKKDPQLLMTVANSVYLSGNYSQAIEMYSQLLKSDSKNDMVYLYRGNGYFLIGDLPKAIADYTQGISLNPNRTDFYVNRARAHSESKSISLAVTDYQKYLGLVPSDSDIWHELMDYQKENGQKDAVRGTVERWLALDPKSSLAYALRGSYLFSEKKYEPALNDFKKATDLDPELASAWYNQALCYENIGIPKEWDLDKKWKRLNLIETCYKNFLNFSGPNQAGRERAKRRLDEITKYSGQVLNI